MQHKQLALSIINWGSLFSHFCTCFGEYVYVWIILSIQTNSFYVDFYAVFPLQNGVIFPVADVTPRWLQLPSSEKNQSYRLFKATIQTHRSGNVCTNRTIQTKALSGVFFKPVWTNTAGVVTVFRVKVDRQLSKCRKIKCLFGKSHAYAFSFHLSSTRIVMWKLHSTFWCAGDKSKQLRELSGIQ